MTFAVRRHAVTFFAAVFIFATPSVAFPQVPKADDIAACNLEAQRAVRAGTGSAESALPNTKDQNRAAQARETGREDGAKSDDSQLAGMDPEGAKDAAYQAAYRTCMRKAGF
jgi:hypothetical protein